MTEKVTHGSTGRRWKLANSMAALIYAPAGNCWDKLPRLRSTNAPRQRLTLLVGDALALVPKNAQRIVAATHQNAPYLKCRCVRSRCGGNTRRRREPAIRDRCRPRSPRGRASGQTSARRGSPSGALQLPHSRHAHPGLAKRLDLRQCRHARLDRIDGHRWTERAVRVCVYRRMSSRPIPVSTSTRPCASVSISRQWETNLARAKRLPLPFMALRPRGHIVQQSR